MKRFFFFFFVPSFSVVVFLFLLFFFLSLTSVDLLRKMSRNAPAITISSDQIEIPRRKDDWHPDPRDLSQTPGGTLYATTPGGTKIVYQPQKLLALAQSPLSKSPITLPVVPGITAPKSAVVVEEVKAKPAAPKTEHVADDDGLFHFE